MEFPFLVSRQRRFRARDRSLLNSLNRTWRMAVFLALSSLHSGIDEQAINDPFLCFLNSNACLH